MVAGGSGVQNIFRVLSGVELSGVGFRGVAGGLLLW